MQQNYILSRAGALLLGCLFTVAVFGQTKVTNLLCEYHKNPIGIDIVNPRLSWQLVSSGENIIQKAYEIRIAQTKSALKKKDNLFWTTGRVETEESVNIVYGGPALGSMQRVWWQVRVWDNKNRVSKWSEPAFWENGLLKPGDWNAAWITMPDEPESKKTLPVQYYRNEFILKKSVESARIYATSLGLYELHLNGEKVGDQLFTPGWTSFNKRLQYQTYDVTSMLKEKNSISAMVSDGWYRGFIGWKDQRNYYGDKLGLLVQLQINYTDGSSEIVKTDNSWKVSTGPILEADLYNGEFYDANLEQAGWNLYGFNDKNWKPVIEFKGKNEILVAPQGPPVKAIQGLKPIKKITTPKGELVYDMGQNMVGWLRIKLSGEKGDTVRLMFAEVLDKEGNFYMENLRSAKCTDTYIFAADGEVVYEPHFTFHGFRFVKVVGVDKAPGMDEVTGVVIHSDMEPTGTFECSNQLVNQLQHNIQWGQKGNFLDVPTDCPQRDERLGWSGDAQVFSMTAGYNFDVAGFYTKWMKDVYADQLDNGKVPHVIPDVLKGGGGATGWADAVAIIPWTVYKIYGDERILKESYPAIVKWIDYMNKRAGEDFLWTGDAHFGDWLAYATTRSDYPGATTEKDLIATAYFYYTSTLAAKMARIVGKKEDVKKYERLASDIKDAFNNEFVTPNGRLVSHTQTAYALALSFDLLPDGIKERAASYLANDVENFKHLTTGFLGTPLLCHVLSASGRDDLAFMLLNRKEYPSWLYPVTRGATTIWERWDGQKQDGTFQSTGMNSFNHYAYGAIGEWLYGWVAGIKVDEANPGYKHFYLQPHPGGGLSYANAKFRSMYGTIASMWKIENNTMYYGIEIPVNTSATVTLPGAAANVLINGKGIQDVQNVDGGVQVKLGSGMYEFEYPYLELN